VKIFGFRQRTNEAMNRASDADFSAAPRGGVSVGDGVVAKKNGFFLSFSNNRAGRPSLST